MKIKSLAFDASGNITVAEGDYVQDNPKKATSLLTVPLADMGTAQVPQTVESAQEATSSGGARIMVKSIFQVPRIGFDPVTNGTYFKDSAPDPLSVHLVVACAKDAARVLRSQAQQDETSRFGLCGLLAKGIMDCVSVIMPDTPVVAPAETLTALHTALFAATTPLRRGLAGLNPIDSANGVYGVIPE
jgi:hypothetical protein